MLILKKTNPNGRTGLCGEMSKFGEYCLIAEQASNFNPTEQKNESLDAVYLCPTGSECGLQRFFV